jgi:hypothetical protein
MATSITGGGVGGAAERKRLAAPADWRYSQRRVLFLTEIRAENSADGNFE